MTMGARHRDLLIEIGTEELPPSSLAELSDAFAAEVGRQFDEGGLGYASMSAYATPRRLAVWVRALSERQPAREQVRKGPTLQAAFDAEGEPTRAAQGFARSLGVDVEALERLETKKGAWLAYRQIAPGKETAALLPAIVQAALERLPIARRMRWADLGFQFVRPVHWIVLLFGERVIDAELFGAVSGRQSRGHRFHHPQGVTIESPAGYAEQLRAAYVVASYAERREAVRQQVEQAAAELGGRAVIDAALLDEVTALVEWPVALVGRFAESFLDLPREVLVATLQDHQKYFPIEDESGELLPAFAFLSNLESRDPAKVRKGNEKVVRPRLEDAEFFYRQDRKRGLASFLDKQSEVVFQTELGSLEDKTRRIKALAGWLAEPLAADADTVARAAELAKCDLLTDMVSEFPELQGTMGRYYAAADGEPDAVAQAIGEQYLPRHAGDRLPATPAGRALAIADRVDTLVGIFSIGQRPTGDKDPFALRRAALGVLRLLIEQGIDLDLVSLLEAAHETLPAESRGKPVTDELFAFMMDRARAYYLDRGFSAETFEAVRARGPRRPYDFHLRIQAVGEFSRLPEAQSLSAANKRIRNILRQADDGTGLEIDADLLVDAAERRLSAGLQQLSAEVAPLFEAQAYGQALKKLAALRDPVDAFFDQVMVMTAQADLRNNRLALLRNLHELFLEVADISMLPARN